MAGHSFDEDKSRIGARGITVPIGRGPPAGNLRRRTSRQNLTPESCPPLYNRVMDLRPLHDRVLVTRLDEVEQKIGGIIIPDSAKEKPQQAEVHAVGNGKLLETGERVPLEVKAGDRILFGKYSGSEIKIEGREYLILKEDEILGVLE